ncbi:MAG TPA: hypothetical protein VFS43_29925 [Polyangiaceae bacterium]|nr:hypothetical protein [Polyangiaceae bacterium]
MRQGAALVAVDGVADGAYVAGLRDVLGRPVATPGSLERCIDARGVRADEPFVREEEAELVLSTARSCRRCTCWCVRGCARSGSRWPIWR